MPDSFAASGYATAFSGGGLHVAIREEDWNVLLRRADFLPDDGFARHFGKEVHARDIAEFLPNWRTLAWKIVPPSLLVKTEAYAIDVVYMVNVKAEYSSNKTHRDLIAAFGQLMQRVKI